MSGGLPNKVQRQRDFTVHPARAACDDCAWHQRAADGTGHAFHALLLAAFAHADEDGHSVTVAESSQATYGPAVTCARTSKAPA